MKARCIAVTLAIAAVALAQNSVNNHSPTSLKTKNILDSVEPSITSATADSSIDNVAFNAKISSGGAHTDILNGSTTAAIISSSTAISTQSSNTDTAVKSAESSRSAAPQSHNSSQSASTSASSSPSPSPSTPAEKCNTEGATLCDASSKSNFFKCVKNVWASISCTKGTECRIVKNNAVCVDPSAPTSSDDNKPTESLVPCDSVNATMCDSTDSSAFYMCLNNSWTHMKCDGANICVVRNNKTKCVSSVVANAPVQPCTSSGATQCVRDNKTIFQTCVDNFWTNSTCSDGNYCLSRSGAAVCVDKALAEAPQIPCSTANATQCFNGDDTIYQICYQNYWTNSTCDKGNVCGTSKGKAVCHDPSQPVVDIPEEPCDDDGLKECVASNETLYRICTKGLWTNLTCASDNICRENDDNNVVCVDKDQAYLSLTRNTMYAPSPFVAHKSAASSLRAACIRSIGVILTIAATAIGASI